MILKIFKDDDVLLLRRNGWKRRVKGKTHKRGWWFHPNWNWCSKEEAIAISNDEESKIKNDLRLEIQEGHKIITELEEELKAAVIATGDAEGRYNEL